MKWVAVAVAVLAVLVALMALIGSQLPRDHVASRTLRTHRTAQEAWTAVTRVTTTSSVPVEIVAQDPPRRLVTRVKDTEKMFGGTWSIAIADAAPAGCTVTITENGWVANPLFRFVSRFVMGHHATIDGVLRQVAAGLNEEPVLTGE